MIEPTAAVLAHHLTYNHYPPLDTRLVHPCLYAIEKASAGEWDAVVTVNGVNGQIMEVTAEQVIEDLHLDEFIEGVSND